MNLEEAYRILFEERFAFNPNHEKMLFVTDGGWNSGTALFGYNVACDLFGNECIDLAAIPLDRPASSKIPEDVAAKIEYAEIIVAITVNSISHIEPIRRAVDRGAKVATGPGTSAEYIIRGLSVGPEYLKMRGDHAEKRLLEADNVRITSPSGTDITVSFNPYGKPFRNYGFYSEGVENIPPGELGLLVKNANGKIVFSYSSETDGDATFWIKDSRIVEWDENAAPLAELLLRNNSGRIVEKGIGLHTEISPDDPYLDPHCTGTTEKIGAKAKKKSRRGGSCHFGLGIFRTFIEDASDIPEYLRDYYPQIHKDIVVLDPEYELDGEKVDLQAEMDWICERALNAKKADSAAMRQYSPKVLGALH